MSSHQRKERPLLKASSFTYAYDGSDEELSRFFNYVPDLVQKINTEVNLVSGDNRVGFLCKYVGECMRQQAMLLATDYLLYYESRTQVNSQTRMQWRLRAKEHIKMKVSHLSSYFVMYGRVADFPFYYKEVDFFLTFYFADSINGFASS